MESASTRRVALLTILSALCIGIQVTPRPPNVEFTSLIIFTIGVFFGALVGSAIGALVMVVNGFLSPWGFAGLILPFQIAGMILVGIGGGIYGRARKGVFTMSSCAEAAVLGISLTLTYDIITNFGVAFSSMLLGINMLPAIATAIIFGAPFSVIHVVSNFFVFLVAFLPIAKALQGVWR